MRHSFLIVLLLVSSQATKWVSANQVAFATGDASFIGLVDKDSTLLEIDLVLHAVTTFCCGRTSDFVKGCQLDLAKVPPEQIASMRRVIRKMLAAERTNKAVLLCVCDSKFDFTKTWLGIHYNRHRFRIGKFDTVANCFGPPGAASLSSKDASNIPPLVIETVTEERFIVAGNVELCILSLNDAILQRTRNVIGSDGTMRTVEFNYNPTERVCFDEGDAFFVAKADSVLDATANTVVLDYYVLPRTSYHSLGHPLNGNQIQLSNTERKTISMDLPIQPKGQRLSITDVPKKIFSQLAGIANRRWFVFVVDKDYDPLKYKLGKRYNETQYPDLQRPLNLEFIDCNNCTETFPTGGENIPWPPSLKIVWKGDVATVRMEEVKLVLVQYWDNVRFYSDGDSMHNNQYVVKQRTIEHWLKGKLIEEVKF